MSNNFLRPNYIDYAKVICMYLVILGHLPWALHYPSEPNILWNLDLFNSSFRIPFFFIVSGMLSKGGGTFDLKKYWTRLLGPYFYLSFIGFIGMIFYNVLFQGEFSLNGVTHGLIAILAGNDIPFGNNPYLGPLWFCYSLFIVNYIFSICKRKLNWGG